MSAVKTFSRSLPVLATLLVLLWSCQPDEEKILDTDTREQEFESFITDAEERYADLHAKKGVDIDPGSLSPCNEVTYDIYAWRDKNIGTITVSNDNEYLIAEFQSEYYLKFTKFLVMVEQTRKWGNREYTYYKKYVYPARITGDENRYAYVIPIEDLNLNEDDKITFAAMAWVSDQAGKSRRHQVFGLAEDRENEERRFWQRWLIDYKVMECTPSYPAGFCAIAWPDAENTYTYNEDQTGFYQSYTLSFNEPLEFVNHTLYAIVDSDFIPIGTVDITYSFNTVYIIIDLDRENYPGLTIEKSRAYINTFPLSSLNLSPEDFEIMPTSISDSRYTYTYSSTQEELYISVATWVCND